MRANERKSGSENREPRSFADWLYKERSIRGWTQQDVADRTRKTDGENYSKSYISALEREEILKPESETVDRIAAAFGVNPAIPRLLLGYTPEGVTPGEEVVFSTGGIEGLSIVGGGRRLDMHQLAENLHGMAEQLVSAAAIMVAVAKQLRPDME